MKPPRWRVLVAVAHHGTKNRPYLDRMVAALRAMPHDVRIVALVEEPKALPPGVEALVGAPTDDPWSLPFAHRQLFADELESYDLFVYAEDDTLIEQRHLDTFVELTAVLPEDLIVGFQRFEVDPSGRRSYCSVHSHYRWDPTSVRVIAGSTFARFTNDHGACYALTREQLRRAIASGGFLVPPHEGRYDMLVSAATDVYVQCGLTRVHCLERMEDQLVHHLPNVYVGQLGVDEGSFDAQLRALRAIGDEHQTATELLIPETRMATSIWDRHSFPRSRDEVLELLPRGTYRLLSLGTSSGAVEAPMLERGVEVVGIPTDPILAAVAARRGLTVTRPTVPSAEELDRLGPFDAVLALDVVGRLERPVEVLAGLATALRPGGALVATAADHSRYRLRNLFSRPAARVPLPASFASDGLTPMSARRLRRVLTAAGYDDVAISHRRAAPYEPVGTGGARAALLGNTLVARATRRPTLDAPTVAASLPSSPRVSIGLPVFNGERYLREALDSLLAQTFSDFEIVISDNASDDATAEICEAYAEKDDRVRYERQPVNRGAATNYNRTFAMARGELFKWAAHDDRCHPRFLEACVRALDDAGHTAVLAYTPAVTIDEHGDLLVPDPYAGGDELEPTARIAAWRLVQTLSHLDMVNAVFGVVRRDALARTRLIDRFVASDYVLMAELGMLGTFVRLDEELLERRKHPGGSRHEANPTLADVAAWFAGSTEAPRASLPPRLRLWLEYLRSATQVPSGSSSRVACAAVVLPTVVAVRCRVSIGRWRRALAARARGQR